MEKTNRVTPFVKCSLKILIYLIHSKIWNGQFDTWCNINLLHNNNIYLRNRFQYISISSSKYISFFLQPSIVHGFFFFFVYIKWIKIVYEVLVNCFGFKTTRNSAVCQWIRYLRLKIFTLPKSVSFIRILLNSTISSESALFTSLLNAFSRIDWGGRGGREGEKSPATIHNNESGEWKWHFFRALSTKSVCF